MFSEKTYSVVGLISLVFLYAPQFPVRPERDPILCAAHGSKTAYCRQSYKESVNAARPIHNSSLRARCAPVLAEPSPSSSRLVERKLCYNNSSDSEHPGFTQIPLPSKPRRKQPKRTRSSSNTPTLAFSKVTFTTPAQVYPTPTPHPTTVFLSRKSVSSPLLCDPQGSPPPYSKHSYPETTHMNLNSDTEDERNEDGMIYTSRLGNSARTSGSSQSLRSRIFGLASANVSRVRDKPICTTPGMQCAGETETETDEPSRHLPTARIIPSSGPLVPPNTLEQRLTPLLFEFSRLLSIVPAIFGTLYNLYHIYHPPAYDETVPLSRPPPERVDFFISALWSILTGYQCLCLATGLLTRWKLYYPPLSTLVRLLALQGICWPATHLTLTILEHEKRPVICWAVIGTTTCVSRSVQLWVTSNLWWEKREDGSAKAPDGAGPGAGVATTEEIRRAYWKRWGGKWGGRRWDWKEVGVKCMLPAGVVYFVMAWAEQLRREWALGAC